jgi:hypothetical protein
MIPITLCLAMSSSAALARDDFCTSIRMLVVLAQDDFRSIDEGPSASGSDSNHTSFVLPGANGCDIMRSDGHPGYWCNWPATSETVAVQTQALVESLRACLGRVPEWAGDDESLSAFFEEQGVEFYVSGDDYEGAYEIALSVEFVGDGRDDEGFGDTGTGIVRASDRNERGSDRDAG